MILPERFYQVNSWTCFVLGLLLNGTLLVLLAKHTTAEMITFRPILVRSTLITIGCLFSAHITQLVVVTHSSYTVAISLGPLWWLPQPYNFFLVSACVMCYMFYNNSLSIIFVIRYFIICRDRDYGVRQFTALLLIVSLPFGLSWMPVLYQTGYVSSAEEQLEAKMRFFNSTSTAAIDGSHRDYVIPFYRRPEYNLFARYLLIYNTTNYSLIFFLAWRIYRHLMGMAEGHMSGGHYRALHLQILSALLLQSLTPMLLVFVPSVGLAVAAATGMKAQSISVYFTAIVSWEPVLNPLIVMCVIKAFRQAMFGWLRKLKTVVLGQGSTATVNPAAMLPTAHGTIAMSELHRNNANI